ncbi:MAG: DNA polymerase III subunit epsilon [Holosporales bacterium]|jgi:DNA polymerase-3 subunit epsilon|nr:DNA polymerase III subunit epsilon [Holosporales bacterium]
MREIAVDTETTGLYWTAGDKITEIGCIEIIDKKITGKSFHAYVNPQRKVSTKAAEISGLTYDFLKNFKTFDYVADEFLNFIKDDKIVIHNAPFDVGFLNFQLAEAEKQPMKNKIVDTLAMAKRKFPGAPATLDALCSRFSVDASKRVKHGALIDAELLAQIYIIMSVKKTQKEIFSGGGSESTQLLANGSYILDNAIVPREFPVAPHEAQEHEKLLSKIKEPLWEKWGKIDL